MEDLLIEGIDDELVREIHELARQNGRTVDDEVIRLLGLGLAKMADEVRRSAKPVGSNPE